MKKRIFASIFIISLALIIAITAIVTTTFYNSYCSSQVTQLKEESQLVIRGVELNGQSYFDSMKFDAYRITWIKADGSVVYDSSTTEELENHLDREEVEEALKEGYGEAKRYSSTILKESIYVAYKINDGTIIRLSCVQDSVFAFIGSSLYPLYFVSAVALVLAIVLAFWISRMITEPLNTLDLEKIDEVKTYPEIKPFIEKIKNQRDQLINDKSEIEKASLIRQDFTSNVTHEMKTPLHVIAGYSELMKEGLVKDKDIKEFSSKIYFESYRLTKLVDDILELAKLDNGVTDESKKEVSLDITAKNVINSLNSVAEKKHITIKSELEPVEIFAVQDIVYSIVYNLVDNAIKYNKENGEISVKVHSLDGKAELTISDTGIGIPSDQLDRIFERFYRVDKSHSRDIGGTGLGLSIVKHGVMVSNAKIEVKSKLNEGTTFKVTF